MRVFLVQHAEAKPEAEDPARHLTEKGMRDSEALGRCLAKNGIRPSEIWHSDKKRSQQTADIIASCFAEKANMVEKPNVGPKDDPRPFTEALENDVMIVGHLPFLGRMVASLLTGHDKALVVSFNYGRCACLVREGKHWSLAWMLDPTLL